MPAGTEKSHSQTCHRHGQSFCARTTAVALLLAVVLGQHAVLEDKVAPPPHWGEWTGADADGKQAAARGDGNGVARASDAGWVEQREKNEEEGEEEDGRRSTTRGANRQSQQGPSMDTRCSPHLPATTHIPTPLSHSLTPKGPLPGIACCAESRVASSPPPRWARRDCGRRFPENPGAEIGGSHVHFICPLFFCRYPRMDMAAAE